MNEGNELSNSIKSPLRLVIINVKVNPGQDGHPFTPRQVQGK